MRISLFKQQKNQNKIGVANRTLKPQTDVRDIGKIHKLKMSVGAAGHQSYVQMFTVIAN